MSPSTQLWNRVRRRSLAHTIRILAVLFAICFAQIVRAQSADLVTAPVRTNERVLLSGHHPAWANAQTDAGAVPGDLQLQSMTIVLSRTPEREQAFLQFLKDQQNPASPDFHHWLTPVEIGQRYGVSAHDIASIKGWLESQGLRLDSVSSSMVRIRFSGPAAAVGTAFGAALHYYTVNSEKRISISDEVQIPAALAGVIHSVSGLYTIDIRPLHVSHQGQITISNSRSGNSPSPTTTANCGGTPCNFVTPADFATIYQLNPVYAAQNFGGGQTIAIIGRSAVDPADISNFQIKTGLAQVAPTLIVPRDGITPPPPATTTVSTPSLDQAEATLDVTRAGSIAPGAIIDLIVSSATQTKDGIQIASEYAVDTPPVPAQVMSISFGACEAEVLPGDVQYWDNLFQQATGEGISVFVASGDSGAAGCDPYNKTPPASQIGSPNYICSSSYSTCVGGTEFADSSNPGLYWGSVNGANLKSVLSYIPEGAWNEPTTNSGGFQASSTGGGVSSVIATPSWQTGPGVLSPATGRYTPDIAFSAAVHDGYFICFAASGSDCVGTSFTFGVSGGTSAAAPDMAGIAALLNASQNQAQGNLNPILYKIAATPSNMIFNDITVATSAVSGCTVVTPSICNNSTPASASLTGGFDGFLVGAGYDEATGLGSINVQNLISSWTSFIIGTSSSATTLASNSNPSAAGANLTLTAMVTTTTPAATGTVTYKDGTSVIGTATLGAGTTVSGTTTAKAMLVTPALASGSHSITATFNGDTNFAVSTSAVLTQVVTGNDPAPHISSINPSSGVNGLTIPEFTATGTNFLFGATINFGGTTVPSAVSSNGTFITANIPGSAFAASGPIGVTVVNPSPGGGASNSVTFTANNPVPTISSISPTTSPKNASMVITAQGSGFVAGSTMTFNGVSSAGTVSNNGNTFTSTVPASSLTAVGTVTVSVSNPAPGGGASNSVNFSIDDFSITGPSQSVTITAGAQASFVLNFATTGGALSAEADFSASGLPPAVTTSFMPVSVVAGLPSIATTFTIITTAHTSSVVPGGKPFTSPPANNPFPVALLATFAMIGLLLLAQNRKRCGKRSLQFGGAAILILFCGALFAGCGGGGGSSINTASGTAAGTYPITVTVTSGSAARTTTVTLIVQ